VVGEEEGGRRAAEARDGEAWRSNSKGLESEREVNDSTSVGEG
jgi:hypothetical protein